MADNTAQLLLQVDASTELLRRNLAAARADIDGFSTGAVASAKKAETALTEIGNGSGFARGQMLELTHVGKSLFDSIAAGQSPMRALSVEMGRIGQIVAGSGGLSGTFAALSTAVGGPLNLALIGVTASAGLAYYAFEHFSSANDDAAAATKHAAEALAEFQKHQGDVGNFIDNVTGRLKEQNRTLIDNARLLRESQIAQNQKDIADKAKTAFRTASNIQSRNPSIVGSGTLGGPIYARETDPAIQQVIDAAAGDVTKLDAGLRGLSASRPDLAATIKAASDAAAQTVLLTRANADLRTEIDQLNGKTLAPSADIIARVTSENDAAAASTYRYTTAIQKLKDAYKDGKGTISQADFEAGVRRADRIHDAEEAAIREANKKPPREKAAPREPAHPNYDAVELPNFKDVDSDLERAQKLISEITPQADSMAEAVKRALGTKAEADPAAARGLKIIADQAKIASEASLRFTEDLSSGLASAIVNAKSVGDALINSIKRAAEELLASKLLDFLGGKADPITGSRSGGLLSGATSLLGGLFADGGVPPAGKLSIVGERGPELIVGNGVANVVPLTQRSPGIIGGSNDNGPAINVYQTIAPNFAGNAATREDVVLMGQIAKQQAIAGVREQQSRRGNYR